MIGSPGTGMRALFALALAGLIAWEVQALFLPVASIRAAGPEPEEIREFAAGVPVGQTFRAVTDGLETAVVEFAADRPASLTVAYRVMGWATAKIDDHWAVVLESSETIALPAGRTRHAFHFNAIRDSSRQVYQFQVQQLEVRGTDGHPAPPGIAIISTRNSLEDGNIIVGKDQIVERDLLFEAKGADSRFDDFRMRISPQLPRSLREPAVQWAIGLLLAALYNWAFAVFAYQTLMSTQPHGLWDR